jgi:predicted phosphoadenosine phosphosulfate sulfurtransferase
VSDLKRRLEIDVLQAARERIAFTFDHFEKIYVSFSAGKDSSVMLHLVLDEAIKRKRNVGVLLIDLEAQYKLTISHAAEMFKYYRNNIEVYWVCLPIKLRNSVSNYEPVWCAWQPEKRAEWVRELPDYPGVISDPKYFDFFEPWMEFEEFIVLFGTWYAKGKDTAAFIGIRCDESLNRFRTIAVWDKEMYKGKRFTTKVIDNLYNIYPIYDWHVNDIWRYHSYYPEKMHNEVYDRMHLAGLSPPQMRLCQPYGDDQKRGLWLYHIIEPETWGKVVSRVNGANSGSLYIEEKGNITGYNKISKPDGHTWKSFCNLLLATMPDVTREHYLERFRSWIKGWQSRGYHHGIPDEAPRALEKKYWAPSWRRLCKVLLRNDWWCKGLGLTQPKSAAYERYLFMKRKTRNAKRIHLSAEGMPPKNKEIDEVLQISHS